MALAPMPTKRIAIEAIYPEAVAAGWSIARLAEQADVSEGTARRFLALKERKAEALSDKAVFKVSRHAGALFSGAAQRQLRRLERLESLEDDKWTRADLYLEKHAIALLKPLSEWCRLRMDAAPGEDQPAKLGDGL